MYLYIYPSPFTSQFSVQSFVVKEKSRFLYIYTVKMYISIPYLGTYITHKVDVCIVRLPVTQVTIYIAVMLNKVTVMKWVMLHIYITVVTSLVASRGAGRGWV